MSHDKSRVDNDQTRRLRERVDQTWMTMEEDWYRSWKFRHLENRGCPQFSQWHFWKTSKYSQSHLGWHFRMLFQSSQLKARTSLFTETWQKRRLSFELWAFENITRSGIGCNWLNKWISNVGQSHFLWITSSAERLSQIWSTSKSWIWSATADRETWLLAIVSTKVHTCPQTLCTVFTHLWVPHKVRCVRSDSSRVMHD